MNAPNPREVIGGNAPPDYAKMETARLADDYRGFANTLQELTELAETLPAQVENDDQAVEVGAVIKRLRDLDTRIEQTRAVEKEPHLRRGNAVDAFFNGLRRAIAGMSPQERRTKPGWIDKLQARIDEHQARKEAAERARLERERLEREEQARRVRKEAERKARAEEEARRCAEEARLAAERARNPDRREEKQQAAEAAEAEARTAAAAAIQSEQEAERAQDMAQEARIATLARPADLTRVRGTTADGGGVTLTTAREKYAVVVDRDELDFQLLAPYFSDAEVEKALRAWARATNYRVPMTGAEIGERRKGVTR